MNLFGRKKAAAEKASPAATANTIRKLRTQLDQLEKREAHLETKVNAQLLEAKKLSQAKDKRGALFALKRKKMFESQIEKIQGSRMTLETQVMTLESAHVNMETFNAMRAGADQMKSIHGQMDVDTVDNIMDDIQEDMATADEIANAISQPIGTQLFDDDELLQELDEMEELDLEDKAMETPSEKVEAPPAPVPAAAAAANPPKEEEKETKKEVQLPEVPTHKVEEDELADLRKLHESMAL